MQPAVLTIAGFDPTGGAGVIADCRILARHQVRPLAVVSALTSQDSLGVYRVDPVSASLLQDQLLRILKETPIAAIKTGLLPNEEIILTLARTLPAGIPLVIDPVLSSSGGFSFLDEKGISALKAYLLPRANLITPNRNEAERLNVLSLGAEAVLITDGPGEGNVAVDKLYRGSAVREFSGPRLPGVSVHGTGCALSAAIAAQIALGKKLEEAIEIAKRDIFRRIEKRVQIGPGRPQLNFDL